MGDYWLAFGIGFVGSFHCLGMCGPIVLAIQARSSKNKALGTGLYHFGKLLSYGYLGLLFSFLGKELHIAGFQRALSLFLGTGIIIFLIVQWGFGKRFGLDAILLGFINKLKSLLGNLIGLDQPASRFFVGLLNGLLPCGLVYLALVGATIQGSPLKGMSYMLLFGLGTMPMLLFVGLFEANINISFRTKIRRAIPFFIGFMGILLILRGLNLGIPYLSPDLDYSSTELQKKDPNADLMPCD